mmetsp:Transcript_24331/g.28667  ORF Transcript_24331/g.28667 Transcript_24331/m.28667 type:complete len:224 (-) Transcript_24331:35-706(-)|eukprot:CAMPEP_0198251590 /NCGR_PEP_ID=MMETSP1447-20131203/2381_1 /TAXON_ID=420782 /ORGANISM="Chaetoceros dichaeta, Strain CCMP1751" /LENGTH=223 /DNA_ID=CAMNT_0043936659 /DNA_START=149 /DNA_END=816 /DNA_ORIENTATION=+
MPKVRRLNKFSTKSSPLTSSLPPSKKGASSQSSTSNPQNDVNEPETKRPPLNRGEKKRNARREKYLKRENMIRNTLKLRKNDDPKGLLDGMDAIKEALTQAVQKNREISRQKSLEASSTSSSTTNGGVEFSKTNKGKRDIAQREIPHLNLVLQHPSFKENPFATMQEHLRNSVAEQKVVLEVQAEKQRQDDQKKLEEKKEEKKERIREMKYQRGRRNYNRRRT